MGQAMPVSPLAEKRIVVIEDNAILKIGLETVLRGAGASLVSSFDQKIDAALLDFRLEHGVTAVPLAQALHRRGVPFAFYTGCSQASLAGIRARWPECIIIAKPASPAEIVEALVGLLGRQGGKGAPLPPKGMPAAQHY
jgi:hypothetical protein